MIYIMADDLTGANDSGVQLSKQGIRTTVYIDPLSWDRNQDSGEFNKRGGLVIDTETRELASAQAGEIIKEVIEKLDLQNMEDTLFYKKIDSTLRGNIGKEIEVLMSMLKKDLCILTPSFPGNKRVTAGGYLLVNNEPLGVSQYYSGDLDPWEGTYVPNYIQDQTRLPVGLVELKDIMQGEEQILERVNFLQKQGKKIIVFDAVIEEHLRLIMNSSMKMSDSILYCGSAGLANYLYTGEEVKKEQITTSGTPSKDPVLLLIGTRNRVMENQIKYLTERIACSYIKIDLSEVFKDEKRALEKYSRKALLALKNNLHLILHPDPGYNREGIAGSIIKKEKITFRRLEIAIRNFLARLTASILETEKVSNLLLTGGDTAIGVCKELSINSLEITEEILPGIPLSCPDNEEYQDIRLITKAGGFGGEDTLYQLVSKLITTEVNGLEINHKQNG